VLQLTIGPCFIYHRTSGDDQQRASFLQPDSPVSQNERRRAAGSRASYLLRSKTWHVARQVGQKRWCRSSLNGRGRVKTRGAKTKPA
jgi:hypothetical protein